MYVTRSLSMYRKNPSLLSLPPPEGPNSGVLVIQDVPDINPGEIRCEFGRRFKELPFPHNRKLAIFDAAIQGRVRSMIFVPVLGQPLSSNQYYCICPSTGAYRSSKEKDKITCCFCCTLDPDGYETHLFNPKDVHQRFVIGPGNYEGGYAAKSVASDGILPYFFKVSSVYVLKNSNTSDLELPKADGLDSILRARLPDFDFILSEELQRTWHYPVVVGEWLCPFMFIYYQPDENNRVKGHRGSRCYVMTLEQHWERIFFRDRVRNPSKTVTVDKVVQVRAAQVDRRQVTKITKDSNKNVEWFVSVDEAGKKYSNFGLGSVIVDSMKRQQEEFGWVPGERSQIRVKRVEEFQGDGDWEKFGLYILVEKYVLRRLDNSAALEYKFRHVQHLRSKWE